MSDHGVTWFDARPTLSIGFGRPTNWTCGEGPPDQNVTLAIHDHAQSPAIAEKRQTPPTFILIHSNLASSGDPARSHIFAHDCGRKTKRARDNLRVYNNAVFRNVYFTHRSDLSCALSSRRLQQIGIYSTYYKSYL